MKKLIAGVCFLALFAACQPVANENTANANKTPETKDVAPPSEADMIAKAKAAWDAFKRKEADAFKKALAPEYVEITPNGAVILRDAGGNERRGNLGPDVCRLENDDDRQRPGALDVYDHSEGHVQGPGF